MRRKLVATAAAAVLLVAACSDDDETTSTETTSTEATSPTSAPVTTAAPETTGPAATTEAPASTATTAAAEPDDAANASDQFESLSTRPWADPDDAHETPEAAVAAFLEFATSGAAGRLFDIDDVAVGGFNAGDARSGEVSVQFRELFFDETRNASVLPVITVAVRQAGPQDTWWVVAATTDGLTVDAPVADAVIGPAFDLDLTNSMIVSELQVRVFDSSTNGAFYAATANGGGVFATGQRAVTIDTTSCDDVYSQGSGSSDFFVEVCDGPGAAGAEGTLVAVSTSGITTVPVVFAE